MSTMTRRKREKLFKTREVANITGVHPRTVAIWLRNGDLPGIKLNGFQWRIKEADLNEFLEGRGVEP